MVATGDGRVGGPGRHDRHRPRGPGPRAGRPPARGVRRPVGRRLGRGRSPGSRSPGSRSPGSRSPGSRSPGVGPVTVYLVGAGPGDPGLLTRRGAELLGRADVVVYDRLIDHVVARAWPRPGAELIDAGKRPAGADAPRAAGTARQGRSTPCWSAGPAGPHGGAAEGGRPVPVRPGRRGGRGPARRPAWPGRWCPGVTSAVAVPACGRDPGDPPRACPPRSPSSPARSATRGAGRRGLGVAGPGRRHPGRPDGHGHPGRDRPAAVGRRPARRHPGGRRRVGDHGAGSGPAGPLWPAWPTVELGSPGGDRGRAGGRPRPRVGPAAPLAGRTVVVTRPRRARRRAARRALAGRGGPGPRRAGDRDRRPRRTGGRPAPGGRRVAGYDWVAFTSANAVAPVRGAAARRPRASAGPAWPRSGGPPPPPWPATAWWPTWCRSTATRRAGLAAALRPRAGRAAGCCSPGRRRPGSRCPRGLAGPGLGGRRGGRPTAPCRRPRRRRPMADAAAGPSVVTFASPSAVDAYLRAAATTRAGRCGCPPVVACIGPVTTAGRPGRPGWRGGGRGAATPAAEALAARRSGRPAWGPPGPGQPRRLARWPSPNGGMRRLRRTPALRRLVAETRLVGRRPGGAALRARGDRRARAHRLAARPVPAHRGLAGGRGQAAGPARGARPGPLRRARRPRTPPGRGPGTPTAIVQRGAGRAARRPLGDELVLMADLCLDEYTDHGHCGVLRPTARWTTTPPSSCYQRVALAQAAAGADVVAPSGMMDGQVAAIRRALDGAGHAEVAVLAYAAKYASALYGPFRDAVDVTIAGGGRPPGLPAGPGQPAGGAGRGGPRRGRGGRHGHGEAGR